MIFYYPRTICLCPRLPRVSIFLQKNSPYQPKPIRVILFDKQLVTRVDH
nr:MAG TPA: hypothetical protein [Bacteriophage sp.]